MQRSKQCFLLALFVLSSAIAVIQSVPGKEEPAAKEADNILDEKTSLSDHFDNNPQPIGRLLAARIKLEGVVPNKPEIEWAAGIGMTGPSKGDYKFKIQAIVLDESGKQIASPFGGSTHSGDAFCSVMSGRATISAEGVRGKITYTVTLNAISTADGSVIELDRLESSRVLP